MFRRVSSYVRPMVAPLALAAVRTNVVFSEQSAVLTNNAKHQNYTSNVWVEMESMAYLKVQAKPDQVPTQVQVTKQLEMYNLDELEGGPANGALPPVEEHTSYKTKKPYGKSMAFELENRAALKQVSSKYWIHPQTAKKEGFSPRRGTKTSIILLTGDTKVFNADQCVEAELLKTMPISGGSRKVYHSESGDILRQAQIDRGFKSNLWYTAKQAEALNLEITPGSDGVLLSSAGGNAAGTLALYNVEQLVDWEATLKSLSRSPSDAHVYLGTGEPIINVDAIAILEATPFKTKFWFPAWELARRGYKLQDGVQPVQIPRADPKKNEFAVFNADQFVDPVAAHKAAGSLVR